MEGYCVVCKTKKEITEPKEILMDGRDGTKKKGVVGKCLVCGTKIFRLLPPPISKRILNKTTETIRTILVFIGYIILAILFLYGLRTLVHFLIY